jgi:hypothetical protein
VTSGASVPETLVEGVVGWFRERGVEDIRSQDGVLESVRFRPPLTLRPESDR